MNISLYPHIKETRNGEDIPLDIFLDRIKNGYWQDEFFNVRAAKSPEDQAQAKRRVPYATVSGRFSERKDSALISHSGFIAIDIDDVDPNETKSLLCASPYVYACFTSISGTGLCAIFRINPERHLDAFYGIAEHLLKEYDIIADPACKDISRARFVSWDAELYLNDRAQKFSHYPKKETKAAAKAPEVVFVQTDFDDIVREIIERRTDITGDYRQWLKCCFAIVDKFGDAGRQYFHAISQFGAYDPKVCDRQFTNCVKAGKSGVTIASFYYLAKQAGINTVSMQTRTVSQYAALGKKNRIAKDDVIKQLADMEGIAPEVSEPIVDQIFNSAIQIDTSESPVDAVEVWIRQTYNMRRNSITRYIENSGKPMEEKDFNTIYIAGLKMFGKLSYDTLSRLIYSDFTPDYNPLIEFLEANQDRQPKGVIRSLFDTINTDTGMGEGQFCPDYAERFGTKWIVGVIASIYGEHSPLMLVLSGRQQNTGKTQWFRRLLPVPLKDYYAESKLDAGTDDRILMTKKLLIMDDEMGGKSKKEAALLKELTSKQVFSLREPYGRNNVDLRRLAVLCGTTNENEILNDPTGNRRIIPINVLSIDQSKYNAIDKTDVLIEAFHLYRNGFSFALNAEDIRILGDNTADFVETAAEAELLNRYFEMPERQDAGGNVVFLTGSEIRAEIKKRSTIDVNPKRLGMELRRAGWLPKSRRRNNMPIKGYWVIIRETAG